MNEIIFLVQESPEGGYEARAVSESIYTEADTLEELREMVRDAVACHFENEGRPKLDTANEQSCTVDADDSSGTASCNGSHAPIAASRNIK